MANVFVSFAYFSIFWKRKIENHFYALSHPPGTLNFHFAPAGGTPIHSTQRHNAHVHHFGLSNYNVYKGFQCAGGESIACNDMP